VILTTATKTKNRKIITKTKILKRVSDTIQENGEEELKLSEALKCEGTSKVVKIKIPTRKIVIKIWGEGEFMGSLGANVDI
jgi:hypothetical protein